MARIWIPIAFRKIISDAGKPTQRVGSVNTFQFYATSRADAVFQLLHHARINNFQVVIQDQRKDDPQCPPMTT